MDRPFSLSINFGGELYRLRTALGKDQVSVAKKARLTRGYYSQLENSRKPPPPARTVERIAEALQLAEGETIALKKLAKAERYCEHHTSSGISVPVAQLMTELALQAPALSNEKLEQIRVILRSEIM